MSWEKVRLGEMAKLVTGKTPPTETREYFEGDLLWINPSDFTAKYLTTSKRTLTTKAVVDKKCNLLPKGAVLLSCIGDIGKVGILTEPGTSNQQITGLILNEKMLPEYLYYFLIQCKPQLENLANKAVVAILNNDRLKDLKVTLPPLSIQKQIADILDKADALRKKDQQLLQKYDELAQGIFIDMFGDPVKNEKGWERKKLSEVCNKITDGTHFSPPSQSSGIPYITAKHVKKYGIDFYSNPTFVNEDDHKEIYSRCSPKKGDVLYIKDGATTGIAAVNLYDFEFSMLSSLALIKPNLQKLNNYYLTAWLNNENVKDSYIRNYMAGAAIRRFTLDKINRFEILVPPIELQNNFELWINNLVLQKNNLPIKESESLFQSLLQQAFNGELIA